MRMKKFGTSASIDESIPAIYREALPVRHERKVSKHKRHPTRPIKRRHSFRDNRDKKDKREEKKKEEAVNP
jgi:hypothetical protein